MKPLQAFTIMDQNRDGFIDKNDLRDTFAALGQTNNEKTTVGLKLVFFKKKNHLVVASRTFKREAGGAG